jgi:hypothetical protein
MFKRVIFTILTALALAVGLSASPAGATSGCNTQVAGCNNVVNMNLHQTGDAVGVSIFYSGVSCNLQAGQWSSGSNCGPADTACAVYNQCVRTYVLFNQFCMDYWIFENGKWNFVYRNKNTTGGTYSYTFAAGGTPVGKQIGLSVVRPGWSGC